MLKVKANETKTTLNFQFSTLTFGRACSRSAIIKQACYCFNGLYTPFGSPVSRGTETLNRSLQLSTCN